ncbi:MAG: hypothetical protein HFJ27_03815 [Clostridia bacterium]|nr:hypothetical protein [Clostridia bacterium]
MTNLRKVCLVMLVVILLGATVVFATEEGSIVITPSNTIVGGNTADNTASNTQISTPQNTSVIQTGNTSNYNNVTNLPQTGADDYAVVLVIAIFAIAAVYAYKKITDYKNI